MSADENKLKSKKTIVAIIAFAALVIVVATAVIWQYVAQSIHPFAGLSRRQAFLAECFGLHIAI